MKYIYNNIGLFNYL